MKRTETSTRCPLQNLGKVTELRANTAIANDIQRTAEGHPCKTYEQIHRNFKGHPGKTYRNVSKFKGTPFKTRANPLESQGAPVHNLRKSIGILRGAPATQQEAHSKPKECRCTTQGNPLKS
jgi:hypothetical protein